MVLPLLAAWLQIAAGNGEQVLSRDVRRLAHNMDFTRLLSWYHTGEQQHQHSRLMSVTRCSCVHGYRHHSVRVCVSAAC